jgi:hypothetical protein
MIIIKLSVKMRVKIIIMRNKITKGKPRFSIQVNKSTETAQFGI